MTGLPEIVLIEEFESASKSKSPFNLVIIDGTCFGDFLIDVGIEFGSELKKMSSASTVIIVCKDGNKAQVKKAGLFALTFEEVADDDYLWPILDEIAQLKN